MRRDAHHKALPAAAPARHGESGVVPPPTYRRHGRPATVIDGGPVDRRSSLPVQLRLPDRQGWLLAAEGTQLAWRTVSGAWTYAGRNAALLPAAATEVRVDGQVLPLR